MSLVLPVTITEEELIKILDNSKKDKHRLAFALGFYECMRVGEISRMQQEDVDYNRKLIHIKQSKGHKDRIIPIAPEIFKAIKLVPLNLTKRALQIAFKKVVLKTLNRNLRFHHLRHSGITHYLVKKKLSTLQVQRIAGHSRSTTTEIYTHIQPEDLVTAFWGDKILQEKRKIEPI